MLDKGMDESVGVIFEHHLLVPNGDWNTCLGAKLRDDFAEWLYNFVGDGPGFPCRGINKHQTDIMWFWYDDRLSSIDSKKWKKYGFKIVFRDPRRATLAKLTWGGKEHA